MTSGRCGGSSRGGFLRVGAQPVQPFPSIPNYIRILKDFLRVYVLPYLVVLIYLCFRITWRYEVIGNVKVVEKYYKSRESCVFAHWHGDELPFVGFSAFRGLAVLSSFSKDGSLMAKVLDILGYKVFRGSSSKGGARGLLKLVKAVKSGSQGALAVDGPKGPIYEVKPGIAELAIRTGRDLVGVRCRSLSCWVFDKTWNKCHLPKPFSRIQIIFTEAIDPMSLDRSMSKKDQIIEVCGRVKLRLDSALSEYPLESKVVA